MNPFATSNEFVSFDYASLEKDSRVDPTVSSALHESIRDDSTVSEVINSKNNDIDTGSTIVFRCSRSCSFYPCSEKLSFQQHYRRN